MRASNTNESIMVTTPESSGSASTEYSTRNLRVIQTPKRDREKEEMRKPATTNQEENKFRPDEKPT